MTWRDRKNSVETFTVKQLHALFNATDKSKQKKFVKKDFTTPNENSMSPSHTLRRFVFKCSIVL